MTKIDQKKTLREFGLRIVEQAKKGKNPEIVFPIRNLSNIIFDKKTRTLKLGNKKGTRQFFNVSHAKRFLQTIEVANIIKKELLDSGKHSSLRDVFYMTKRTIPGTSVNLVDEQTESLAPDEPILVRIDDRMKFMTGEEILMHSRTYGYKIFDDGKKERYTNVGLKVCAFDENYKIREIPATLVIKHPPNNILKITTASGKSVKVTLCHSLFVSKEGLPYAEEARNLQVGDWVAVPRNIKVEQVVKEIDFVEKLIRYTPDSILSILTLRGDKKILAKIISKTDQHDLRDFIKKYYISNFSTVLGNWKRSAIPLRLVKELHLDLHEYYNKLRITAKGAKHSYNTTIKCDSDLALVQGLLLSEGCHSLSKRDNSRSVCISNKKKYFIEKFYKSFSQCFGEKPAGKIYLAKDGVYRLNVGYDLFSYILEYCLEYPISYAWEKFLPFYLFDADDGVIRTFIKWFKLGDGSVYNTKTHKLIRFHTTSNTLVNGLLFLLLRLGIQAKVYSRDPKKDNHHIQYEIRIANRGFIDILNECTLDFQKQELVKKTNYSGDKLIRVGSLIKQNVDKLKLNERAYKQFNWYGLEKQEVISRGVVENSILLLEKFGKIDELLKIVVASDIAWDKITKIENAGIAPYTIDLAVPPTQNFIGGNGLLILHNSDKVIEDLEVITDLSREQLHVNANKNGSVAGKVIIEDKGDIIDWSKLGSGGWSIPSNVENIVFKKVNVKYILYMEKAAVWERLNEDKYWLKNDAIIISSQGQTTRGIRRLLQRLYEEFGLPIYVFCDGDIYGAYIYSVIKYGSIALAHASERLTIPGVKYVGITMEDIEKYDLKRYFIKLDEKDRARIKQVSEYEWFKDNKDWQRQFSMMKKFNAKVEIQSLSSKGISFVSEKYLPTKIKNKEFLD